MAASKRVLSALDITTNTHCVTICAIVKRFGLGGDHHFLGVFANQEIGKFF